MAKEKTEEEKYPNGKVKYNGKFIPKAADGLPNATYVGKLEKEALRNYRAQMKADKKKVNLKQFMAIINGGE
jgi:hypothetical protein